MIESEKKLLLSKNEYDYLVKHFGCSNGFLPKPIIKQINYYFDTDDFYMDRQNVTCRIRFKNGSYKGMIKTHSTCFEQSKEIEIKLRNGLSDNAFIDMGLKLQGTLTTHRLVLLKGDHFEAVIDKNEYLGTSDYELEIEYSAEHEKDAQAIYHFFLDILMQRKHSLTHKENYHTQKIVPSKSKRFFNHLATSNQSATKK